MLDSARASQVVLVVKNPLANAEDIRDVGSIPELRRSPGGGHSNPLQYSCLEMRIPWTEKPGRLQSMDSQRVGHNCIDLACMHITYLVSTIYGKLSE